MVREGGKPALRIPLRTAGKSEEGAIAPSFDMVCEPIYDFFRRARNVIARAPTPASNSAFVVGSGTMLIVPLSKTEIFRIFGSPGSAM